MMLGAVPLATTQLASPRVLGPGSDKDWALSPLDFVIDGLSRKEDVLMGSMSVTDVLGEQMTASFTLVDKGQGLFLPTIGASVRITFYSQIEFLGKITKISASVEPSGAVKKYLCQCSDNSQILTRHVVFRNFTNASLADIVQSVLAFELLGEGLSFGTSDLNPSLPVVESNGGRTFDLFRDAASMTGQTMYVDELGRIQFRSTTNQEAPLHLEPITTQTSLQYETNLDGYRNVQMVKVTGSPGPNQTANEIVVTQRNEQQIQERISIEGGAGIYSDFEEITHPTSNLMADLLDMANGYATLRLATSGVPKQILKCLVRGYGFRAGQFGIVDLAAQIGADGNWLIQSVKVIEASDGRTIKHQLELVRSSLQERVYEAWLRIVQAGKIFVQMPGANPGVHGSVLFTSPGAANWTVPADVFVITITTQGGSGSGAGGGNYRFVAHGECLASPFGGGAGGNSGKAIATVNVTPGQELNLVIGTGGTPGGTGGEHPNSLCGSGPYATSGVDGTETTVHRNGILLCQAGPGLKATPGLGGAHGSGSGGIVIVGGGKQGGNSGDPFSTGNGGPGLNGDVLITW